MKTMLITDYPEDLVQLTKRELTSSSGEVPTDQKIIDFIEFSKPAWDIAKKTGLIQTNLNVYEDYPSVQLRSININPLS